MASSKMKSSWGQKEVVIKIVGETKKVVETSDKTEETTDEGISNNILNILSNPLKHAEHKVFDNKITGKHLVAQYIFDNAVDNAKNIATFSYNKYLNLSENYLLENNVQAVKKGLDTATGFATSIIAGAKLGSAGGPWGMAIGAAVGATAYGVSQYISYEQKKYGYYNQIAASTYQSQYSQIRAGLVDGGRNTNE